MNYLPNTWTDIKHVAEKNNVTEQQMRTHVLESIDWDITSWGSQVRFCPPKPPKIPKYVKVSKSDQ